ncbi:alcohol dehydrogenase catalytic domain-containing protein [Candidatus Poribacteria bacterium]|nr:alcohol dehydrogenase catalytic domain-containing protein [Candidatus Poribacteria bacterium]
MKAVVFDAPGKFSIREMPDPEIKPDEVLIAVKASGVCGTDIHIYDGDFIADYPLIPGHEFSGEIVEAGKDVENFRVGDKVAVDPCMFCRKCSFCRENRENFCINLQAYGVHVNGGFAEFAAVKEANIYNIQGLSFVEGALVEPVGCGIHGIKQVGIDIGDHVLIFGSGPIGLILMQLCKNSGAATLTVVDLVEEKLELAKKLGATNVIKADDDLQEKLKSLRSEGFQVVIDATGSPAVVESMFNYVRDRGRILFFGVCPQKARIQISPYDVYKRELKIYGTFSLLHTSSVAIDMIREKKINAEALVSHKLPLDQFDSAFEMMHNRASSMKIIIEQ